MDTPLETPEAAAHSRSRETTPGLDASQISGRIVSPEEDNTAGWETDLTGDAANGNDADPTYGIHRTYTAGTTDPVGAPSGNDALGRSHDDVYMYDAPRTLTEEELALQEELDYDEEEEEVDMLVKEGPKDTETYTTYDVERFLLEPAVLGNWAYDPLDLFDPSVPGSVIPGARRYAFHSALSAEEERKCETKLTNLCLSKGMKPGSFHITFPSGTGRRRFVQVAFTNVADFTLAGQTTFQFTWNNRPVELAYSAGPLPKSHHVFKISKVATSPRSREVLAAIHKTLDPFVEITHIWRDDKKVVTVHEGTTSEEILIGDTFWVYSRTKKNPATGLRFTPSDLPGWIRIGNQDKALHFKGRSDRCGICKSKKRFPLHHDEAECTYKRCIHCGQTGHIEGACPPQTNKRPRYGWTTPTPTTWPLPGSQPATGVNAQPVSTHPAE